MSKLSEQAKKRNRKDVEYVKHSLFQEFENDRVAVVGRRKKELGSAGYFKTDLSYEIPYVRNADWDGREFLNKQPEHLKHVMFVSVITRFNPDELDSNHQVITTIKFGNPD